MKNISYLILGVIFGAALTKGEAISWYRIQEMFYFQSFHMYGIFATAIPVGMLSVLLIKRFKIKTMQGDTIMFPQKKYHHGLILGGLISGIGWGFTGVCPGPLYAQVGSGFTVVITTILSALTGTWVYSYIRAKLSH